MVSIRVELGLLALALLLVFSKVLQSSVGSLSKGDLFWLALLRY